MTNFKERLKEYLETDQIYQDYKKGKEPAHNDGCSDFDWFCIKHCEDIEKLLKENHSLRTRIKTIKRLRKKQTQKKNKYKSIVTDFQKALEKKNKKIDKAINHIKEQGCYDEDCNVFCDDLNYYAIPRLLEILEKDSDVDGE